MLLYKKPNNKEHAKKSAAAVTESELEAQDTDQWKVPVIGTKNSAIVFKNPLFQKWCPIFPNSKV